MNVIVKKQTPAEVEAWVDEVWDGVHDGGFLPLTATVFKGIIENVSPELCGYAFGLLASKSQKF